MTLANKITVFRLFLIPVFVTMVVLFDREAVHYRWLALGVFVLASVSDGIDGYIARAYDQRTKLGAALDPLADKLLINIAFVFLAWNREFETQIPLWLPVLILSRDSAIAIGAYFINEQFGPLKVSPRMLGKVNTTVQMACIIGVLLEVNFAPYLLVATIVVAVVSLADYIFAGVQQVRTREAL